MILKCGYRRVAEIAEIQEIRSVVAQELQAFEKDFLKTLKTDVDLINSVIFYLAAHKGKRLRPLLIFLIANLEGGSTQQSIEVAVIVELIHTATLIHDDIVDEAELRRGGPSVNAVWNNQVSVLVGDFLFSQALRKMVELDDAGINGVISKVTIQMSEGELLQIERAQGYELDESTYFRMISNKTASLISASCQLGALTSLGRVAYPIEKFWNFGEYLGRAFQIQDDLLDYLGDEEIVGKPVGNDLKESKITLPLLYALNNSKNGKSARIKELLEKGDASENFNEIRDFVIKNGGVDYSRAKARDYIQKAVSMLEAFQPSLFKDALVHLVEFAANREK